MSRKRDKTKEEKLIEKEEKQRKMLEKLGFAQTMFDFYTSPIV